ncbi:hypothetical protein K2173_028530 [Erythroxylum novogranatense]|uniref:Histone-lysine N-methyltransferase ASHR1 n=1 Tax=Erythroxylum novogranatense TaxID=1862640 RepID=A0AAV8U2D6_9ROSI|nr:hypothetical protein K2173_028530 [Erythroxylum novogranatense]
MEDLGNVLAERGLTVANHPQKGRSLRTTKDFNPGDVILSQEPYVCAPKNSNAEWRCDGCFASTNLKKCSGCQVVWYCGSSCQKLEWKLHRLECGALAKLEKDKRKSVTPSIRLMIKLFLRKKLQTDKIIPTTATDNYSLVEVLVSHMKEIDEKQLVLYAQMANLVSWILQLSDVNIKEIAENFSKLACNAHTICDSELRPLGTGVYPVISIINHSCLPNAILIFEGRSAVVRAIQPIPKGDEVTITYIETAASTVTRQKALKEQYFFVCTCPRCIKVGQRDDIEESAILEGYRCRDERCNGFLLRDSDDKGFICQQCGILRSKEEVKKISTEVKAISDKLPKSASSVSILFSLFLMTNVSQFSPFYLSSNSNHIPTAKHKDSLSVVLVQLYSSRLLHRDQKRLNPYLNLDNQEIISVYKMIERLQRNLFHPFSVSLIQTREQLIKLLMEAEDWREALYYCGLTIPVYLKVYPKFHPLPGLQYYTSGKLEWLLGDTNDAVQSLSNAVDILRITHGTNTPFMKELIMKLEEARAEAAYNLSSTNE